MSKAPLIAAVLFLAMPAHAQDPGAKPKPPAHARPARKAQPARTPVMRCRDVRTHTFTKCGGPYAEPSPASG